MTSNAWTSQYSAIHATHSWCSLTHGVAGLVQVDDSGLLPDHHGQTVDDALAADATVPEALEREVVRATSRGCIDLHCACLHSIADAHCCVDVLSEQASLQDTSGT